MASLELDKAPVLVDAASAALELTRIDSIGAASVMTEMSRLAVDLNASDDFEVPASSTASISLSLYEHVEGNGRTYHKYKDGKYFFPNDERLNKFDQIFNISYRHPNAQVIGSDLSPIRPEFVPENLTFEVNDIDDEWVYNHPFYLIHGRLMNFCMRSPIDVFRKAFNAVEPGGYLEMQDITGLLQSLEGTADNTMILRVNTLICEAASEIGIDTTSASRYKSIFEEVGFEDVKETIVEWPLGPWAKSAYHKKIGAMYGKDIDMGVEGIIMGVLTRILGIKKEEVQDMVVQARNDINNRKIHAYQSFYVVYRRRPFE